mgnify:CR=1 FL=1
MHTYFHAVRLFVFVAFCAMATNAAADEQAVPAKVLDQIRSWTASPVVLLTLEASNKRHSTLTEESILTLDKQWPARCRGI